MKTDANKIIAVKDLSKSFGEHQVLRKIDFSVEKGEVMLSRSSTAASTASSSLRPSAAISSAWCRR